MTFLPPEHACSSSESGVVVALVFRHTKGASFSWNLFPAKQEITKQTP
jgi:hypothetical protein